MMSGFSRVNSRCKFITSTVTMKLFTFLLLLAAVPALCQHSAGFRSITRFDNTRPAVEEQSDKRHGRIIQVNVWYPSEKSGSRMTLSDYVALAGLELDSSLARNWYEAGVNRYFAWPESAGADKKSFTEFLEKKIPMHALNHATPLQQKFPLIMLVHGYAVDHAYLAEELARKGFVVMQVPVKGTLKTELDYEGKGLESQVLDYEFGLKILMHEFSNVTNDIGVAGFSFGGQSAAALALRNSDIKAIVSLDGGIGSAFGAQLLQAQSYYDAKKLNQPILHFYNARDQYTDLTWMRSAPNATRWLVAMKNMEHGHFTSFGMINQWLPGIMGKDAPDPGRGYEAVVRITKDFFGQILLDKKDPGENFIPNLQKEKWIAQTIEKHSAIFKA